MARGSKPGERRGGRQKGTQNRKTVAQLEMVNRATAEGVTPLEVMLSTMHALWDDATDEAGKVVDFDKAQLAHDVAKDAAPFMHARLSAVQADVDVSVGSDLREWMLTCGEAAGA